MSDLERVKITFKSGASECVDIAQGDLDDMILTYMSKAIPRMHFDFCDEIPFILLSEMVMIQKLKPAPFTGPKTGDS